MLCKGMGDSDFCLILRSGGTVPSVPAMMLMVARLYKLLPFLVFLDLVFNFEDTGIDVFWLH